MYLVIMDLLFFFQQMCISTNVHLFCVPLAAQLQNLLQSGEISQQQLMEVLTSGALGGGPGGGMGALESLL